MDLYTIGFTKTTAEDFFERLGRGGIERVLDVRLNNLSQLAGFAKRDDLKFFLRAIGKIDYIHEPILAPTQDLLDAYKKAKGSWAVYAEGFLALMRDRRIETRLSPELLDKACLLCSEHSAERCHRRLVAEYLNDAWPRVSLSIIHL